MDRHFKGSGVLALIFVIALALFLLAGCTGGEPPENTVSPVDKIPDDILPFPSKELTQGWDLGDGDILLERIEGHDRYFYLYHASRGEMELIICFIENATFERQEGDNLLFVARGGDDTGNFDFPYRLNYNLSRGELFREDVFLPLEQSVAFGKDGWKQVLERVNIGQSRIEFDFVPQEGEVLAGGHNRPLTTVTYQKNPRQLTLNFYSVAAGDNLKAAYKPEESNLPFTQVSLQESPASNFFEEDSAVLRDGFPYGLPLGERWIPEGTGVQVNISLSGNSYYNIKTISAEEGGVLKYILELAPAAKAN